MAEEVFGDYVVELEHRTDRLARLDRRLKEVAGWDSYRRPVGWLRCFRGIDTLTAVARELAGFIWGVLRLAAEQAPAAGDAGADVGRPAAGRVPRSSLGDDPQCRGGAWPSPPARHPASPEAAAGGKAGKRPQAREFFESA